MKKYLRGVKNYAFEVLFICVEKSVSSALKAVETC